MAYAALVSLSRTMQHILSHDCDQSSNIRHVKQQIRALHDNIVFLQSFLEEFTGKIPDDLQGRMRDIAYEAEDIIESFILEQIRFHYDFQKLYHLLRKTIEGIDSIKKEVMEIKNSVGNGDEEDICDLAATSSSSTPTAKDTMVVGFDDDLMAIKTRLCGESSKLEVIPIVGMGGIGKTTLARIAYEDPLIVERFQIRAWVTVSQDYNAQAIVSSIQVSINAFNEEHDDQHRNVPIEEHVYKSLNGRRYLVVMDDMWSTEAWDVVRRVLPNDYNGSRIMLTTRLSSVAAYPDSSSSLHEMQFLDEDQSWNLLRTKVFKQKQCPRELEDIGRMIARSCRGLPLAIVVVAGVMSTGNKSLASWKNIAKDVSLVVTTKNEHFEKILSLSYIHLPHHLRPCFLYMGGFPEDHQIQVSKLIKLWAAEGFLKRIESRSYEEGAVEYLDDLVKRSLVLVTKRKPDGRIKSCSLHDLLRDMCIKIAQNERFFQVMNRYADRSLVENMEKFRRLSIHSKDGLKIPPHPWATRTIIYFLFDHISPSLLKGFRLLRVLDLVNTFYRHFPTEILELFQLRYLALNCKTMVPPSISNLQNLETLIISPKDIRPLPFTVSLPFEIWKMTRLRHLVSFHFNPLPDPIGPSSTLENLQTLSSVTNFKCTTRVLKMIPNLKKLGIYIHCSGFNWENYHLDNLVHLHELEKFKLVIRGGFYPQSLNLDFPTTLKRLTLDCRLLPYEDMTVFGALPNLEVLKLKGYACRGPKWETNEGEFSRLKFLLIEYSDLQQWITESSHFPSLERLVLRSCNRLRKIPDDIGEIPTLELIEVDDRNNRLVESAKRIQEEQRSYGNDDLQVRIKYRC